MSISKVIIVGMATAMFAFGAPAIAQEMNHSGTNVPDGTDMNRNIDQGKADATKQPDTRSTAKHSIVRHKSKHVRKKSKTPM